MKSIHSLDVVVLVVQQDKTPEVFIKEILEFLQLTQTYDFTPLIRVELFSQKSSPKIIYPTTCTIREDSILIQDSQEQITITKEKVTLKKFHSYLQNPISFPISELQMVRFYILSLQND